MALRVGEHPIDRLDGPSVGQRFGVPAPFDGQSSNLLDMVDRQPHRSVRHGDRSILLLGPRGIQSGATCHGIQRVEADRPCEVGRIDPQARPVRRCGQRGEPNSQ